METAIRLIAVILIVIIAICVIAFFFTLVSDPTQIKEGYQQSVITYKEVVSNPFVKFLITPIE